MANMDIQKLKSSLEEHNVDIQGVNEAISSLELNLFGIHELINSPEIDDKEKLSKVKELLF